MNTPQKTYILAPLRRFPPEGPIQLGNLVKDPAWPEQRLNMATLTPNSALTMRETGYRVNLGSKSSVSGGIYAQFLQTEGFGVGGSLDLGFGKKSNIELNCEEIVTSSFWPNESYLQQSLEDTAVKRWLGQYMFSKSLYMITGIMVAKGASGLVSHAKNKSFNLQFQADASAIGLPLSVGLNSAADHSGGREESWDHSSDFVLAYQLARVNVSRKGVGTVTMNVKGGVLDTTTSDEQVLDVQLTTLDDLPNAEKVDVGQLDGVDYKLLILREEQESD